MSKKTRSALKPFFETGDVPMQAQFEDLIDSFKNLTDSISSGDAGKYERIKSDESGWENFDLKGNILDKKAEESNIVLPLDIPDYDGKNSVTHPDVVFIPDGWNGYRYWMAYTPFPDSQRENPSIVASNDGVNWEAPSGLTNPVVGLNDGPSGPWSDTDLVLMSDNKLGMYFRKVSNDEIYLVTSSDGVSWTAENSFNPILSPSLDTNSNVSRIFSPTVVLEDDGTYKMWVSDNDGSTDGPMYLFTSADGLDWGGSSLVTLPSSDIRPFHQDVVKVNNTYHMLLNIRQSNGDYNGNRLYYLTSSDGLSWDGLAEPAVPRSGLENDAGSDGHYRSTFLPRNGNPIKWDVWVSMRNFANDPDTDPWKLYLQKGIVLEDLQTRKGLRIRQAIEQADNIFVPATTFFPSTGSPSLTSVGARSVGMEFSASATNQILANEYIPSNWQGLDIKMVWVNTGSGGGDIRIATYIYPNGIIEGESLGSTDSPESNTLSISSGQQNILNIDNIYSTDDFQDDINDQQRRLINIRFQRKGADSIDTLADTIAVIGFIIQPRDVYLGNRTIATQRI